MKSLLSILAAPACCLLLLSGIVVENASHVRPQDAEPFHAAAKAAIVRWTYNVDGAWNGRDHEIPAAAIDLLRPNVTLCRRYTSVSDARIFADLLIVQCREPDDMSGHYPPNCYPNNGNEALPHLYRNRTWQIGDVTINGMEYHFQENAVGQTRRKCVYNFFIVPGRGITGDMKTVRDASGDYQRRHYGAAQFQVVFHEALAEMPQRKRDEVFRTLIGSNPGVFAVLNPKGI